MPECLKTVTGEHWWLRLLGGGRKCYFCGKVEQPEEAKA